MAWEIETVYNLNETALLAEIIKVGIEPFLWDVITDPKDPGYNQYQNNIKSYTVPVGIQLYSQIQFGGTANPIPVWENVRDRFLAYVGKVHTAEVAALDVIRTAQSLVGAQLTGVSKGKTWANCKVEPANLKPTWAKMKAEWLLIQSKDAKVAQVRKAYEIMETNIENQVFLTFGTRNEASANASSQSWQIKLARAIDYVNEGLVAREAIATFNIGDPLDTEQKIISYYGEKVKQLIAFDKFRDAEIAKYLAVKAAAGI